MFQYKKNISRAFVSVCCIISLVNITSNIKGLKLSVPPSTDTTNTQQNEPMGTRGSFEDDYNQSVKGKSAEVFQQACINKCPDSWAGTGEDLCRNSICPFLEQCVVDFKAEPKGVAGDFHKLVGCLDVYYKKDMELVKPGLMQLTNTAEDRDYLPSPGGVVSAHHFTTNQDRFKVNAAAADDATEVSTSGEQNPVEDEPECQLCLEKESELNCDLKQWHSGHEDTKTAEHTELVCADCKKQWLDTHGTCAMCRMKIAEPVAEKAEEYENALLDAEEQEELEHDAATYIQQFFQDSRSPLGLRAARRAREEAERREEEERRREREQRRRERFGWVSEQRRGDPLNQLPQFRFQESTAMDRLEV